MSDPLTWIRAVHFAATLALAGAVIFGAAIAGPALRVPPGERAGFRVRLLRELAASRESVVAAHLPFPAVGRVAVAGDVFRWVPATWEY